MKKINLINNPELFQGEKYLNTNKNYFEGWYFKNTSKNQVISFIPGININKYEKKAFIQIITNNNSYFVDYDIDDFEYGYDPFYVKIGNNFFSRDNIHIDIKDKKQNLVVYGEVKYSNRKTINTNVLAPNIMGPFSYVPFMECNHAVISMKTESDGLIVINNKKIYFNKGIGYIEKDWGYSFPKTYIWIQGNDFKNIDASFMISIADIYYKFFRFRGFICSLIVSGKEYRFATYNNTKLLKYDISNNWIEIKLKKGHYYLEINSKLDDCFKLKAPVNGKMSKDVLETISATVEVTLKKDDEIILSNASKNCGLEVVYE